jgi:hypothetical protein
MEELKQELLFGVSDLDPAQWFAFNLLGFLGGFRSTGAFRLQA